MKITGSYTIDAPQDQVWEALNDIEVLARIVPGCERLEQTGENEFEGTVKIGIQTIKGTYSGRIRLEDIQPPHHYRLVASGRSSNGVVDGAGTVDLSEEDGKTILRYGGDAQIGGTLASVGQRLIESASKQMINQSLKALVEQIKIRAAPPAPAAAAPTQAEDAPPEPPAEPPSSAAVPPPSQVAPAQEQTNASDGHATPAVQAPPASVAQTSWQAAPEFERRTVVVPEHEQLSPEAMVRGVIEDVLKERPWLPLVALAFVLGFLFGRARGN